MPEPTQIFVITSVIHFSNKKLLGGAKRSVFSPEERASQTIKTIQSIKQKVPKATIVLLEMGKNKNISADLTSAVDKYFFIGDKVWVKWAVNGKYRGLGEAVGLLAAHRELSSRGDFFFKISGRYFLNEHFDLSAWKGDRLLARKYGNGISTRLYGFDKELFSRWQSALKRSLPSLYRGRSIEDVFPSKFGNEKIQGLARLGITGYVAPDGSLLEE